MNKTERKAKAFFKISLCSFGLALIMILIACFSFHQKLMLPAFGFLIIGWFFHLIAIAYPKISNAKNKKQEKPKHNNN